MKDHPLVPRDKSDLERAKGAAAAGYPAVQDLLPDLFVWVQDGNWPVAKVLAPFLGGIGVAVVPEVRRILESDDDTWKYWVLRAVLSESADVVEAVQPSLKRIVEHPTLGEKAEGVLEEALELLKR